MSRAPSTIGGVTGAPPGSAQRIGALDGVRGAAALLIFFHHSDQAALPGGYLAVSVFFVASGFVITGILRRDILRGGVRVREFLVRRVSRLVPPLVPVVVVCVYLQMRLHLPSATADGLSALAFITDIRGTIHPHASYLAHTWSLGVEAQLYLLWLLFLPRSRWRVPTWIFLAAVTIAGSGAVWLVMQHGWAWQYSPFGHAGEFAAGAAIAVLSETPSGRRVLGAVAWRPLVAVVLIALVVAVLTLNDTPPRIGPPLVALGGMVLIAAAITHGGAVIEARPLRWLGVRSYGFYLWHYAVIVQLGIWGYGYPVRAGGGLVVTIVIAAASWRFLESPLLRRAAAYRHREQDPRPASAAEDLRVAAEVGKRPV